MLVAIVFVEQGQRRIPVQFAKRGRRPPHVRRPEHLHPAEGQPVRRHPDHLRQLGALPAGAAHRSVLPADGAGTSASASWIDDHLRPARPRSATSSSSALLIIGFAYFYTAISFDPVKQADTIRKQGGFIPGIRPGPQTERYLAKILSRITLPGALFIAAVALVPPIVLARPARRAASSFGFGGTRSSSRSVSPSRP